MQAEVEQCTNHRLAVDEHMLLGQVPATGPHDRYGQVTVVERVLLAVRRGERQLVTVGVVQRDLALDHVRPVRSVGVLEIGEPHLGAGVERIDGHLRVGRAGDLDASVLQGDRGRRDPPVGLTHVAGLVEEVEGARLADRRTPVDPRLHQLVPPAPEHALQLGHERQRLRRQDLVLPRLVTGYTDLDSTEVSHVTHRCPLRASPQMREGSSC